MSDAESYPDEFDPTAGVKIVAGRGAPFTDVGEWVLLAKLANGKAISDKACRVYWLLRAHVNKDSELPEDRQNLAWPKVEQLARMAGVEKYDSITTAIKQLVEIGAVGVDVQRFRGGMRKRNVYTVHREPPPGYTGLLSTNAWHVANPSEQS